MTRQEANIKILKHIEEVVNEYPDLRFGQILANLGIVEYEYNTYDDAVITKDPFHVESVDTLKKIKYVKSTRRK